MPRPDHQRRGVVELGVRAEVAQAGPRHGRPARVAVRDGIERPDAVVARVGDEYAAGRADVDGRGEPELAAAAQGQDVGAGGAEHLYAVVARVGDDDIPGRADGYALVRGQVGVCGAARPERALVRAVGGEHLHPAVARVGHDVPPAPVGGEAAREFQPPVALAAHRERPGVRAVPAEHLHAAVGPVGDEYAAGGVDACAPRIDELPVGGSPGPELVQRDAAGAEHRHAVVPQPHELAALLPPAPNVRHDDPALQVDRHAGHAPHGGSIKLAQDRLPHRLAGRAVHHYAVFLGQPPAVVAVPDPYRVRAARGVYRHGPRVVAFHGDGPLEAPGRVEREEEPAVGRDYPAGAVYGHVQRAEAEVTVPPGVRHRRDVPSRRVEHLDAGVALIGDHDPAVRRRRHAVGFVELARARPAPPEGRGAAGLGVEDEQPVVQRVGHHDPAVWQRGRAGWPGQPQDAAGCVRPVAYRRDVHRRRLKVLHAPAERVGGDDVPRRGRVDPRQPQELAVGRALPADRADVVAGGVEHL